MSGAVIFLAPSLALCHSHFPSVMSLRRSCLVTLWCHISGADGSLPPLQHVHRCYNWSPEWLSKVASLITMWASNSACCLMASADQIPVGDVGETLGMFDWWQICVSSTTLYKCKFFLFWLLFLSIRFFWQNKFVRSEWLSLRGCIQPQSSCFDSVTTSYFVVQSFSFHANLWCFWIQIM